MASFEATNGVNGTHSLDFIWSALPDLQNFIDGSFVNSHSGQSLDNVDPATQSVICRIPRSNSNDIVDAVAAAKKAFPVWSSFSAEKRATFLDAIANEIEKRIEEFAALESRDTGKPLSLTKSVDIPRAISNFRFFAGAIRHDSVECHHMADALNFTQRWPVGVCGLITPWNLPIYLLSWKVAPALAMGNTVICKPSEMTPLTANALAQVCKTVGLPAGVVNIVHGLGGECGDALTKHEDVPLISFTGGTVTGKRVAANCAPLFKKLSLELGGKNATVVFGDCDFDKAVDGVWRASFANQGQICLCGSRLYIEHSIYDKFIAALLQKAKTLKIGNPRTAQYGALISTAHRQKIESYVEAARKSGGQILCGGSPPKLEAPFSEGAFYEPTLIAGLPHSHACVQEEIFGPVVTVHSFEDEKELMEQVNGVRYGLAGSLWTSNLQRTMRITQKWETGMCWVNCWLHRDLRVPFGGVKDSGVGTEGGKYSMEFYSHTKNICIHHDTKP